MKSIKANARGDRYHTSDLLSSSLGTSFDIWFLTATDAVPLSVPRPRAGNVKKTLVAGIGYFNKQAIEAPKNSVPAYIS